jgi:hypothetical protein
LISLYSLNLKSEFANGWVLKRTKLCWFIFFLKSYSYKNIIANYKSLFVERFLIDLFDKPGSFSKSVSWSIRAIAIIVVMHINNDRKTNFLISGNRKNSYISTTDNSTNTTITIAEYMLHSMLLKLLVLNFLVSLNYRDFSGLSYHFRLGSSNTEGLLSASKSSSSWIGDGLYFFSHPLSLSISLQFNLILL